MQIDYFVEKYMPGTKVPGNMNLNLEGRQFEYPMELEMLPGST